MNPYAAYQQLAVNAATRIDNLLALFDGAIERIEAAQKHLSEGDKSAAVLQIGKAQLIVSGLSSGVAPSVAPELAANVLRLYEFVAHQLAKADPAALSSALDVLRNLREGFEAIRIEAVKLERSGQIPPADSGGVSSLA